MGSLNQTVLMVFLMPLRGEVPQGRGLHCGKVIRGPWKVMHLAVFLKPPGLGELGTVTASMWNCAARLGPLNSRITKHSNVAYESMIWQLVASSNM